MSSSSTTNEDWILPHLLHFTSLHAKEVVKMGQKLDELEIQEEESKEDKRGLDEANQEEREELESVRNVFMDLIEKRQIC